MGEVRPLQAGTARHGGSLWGHGQRCPVVVQVFCSGDMHEFRTDIHNLLGSATQSDSTNPLGVDNTCLRQLLDRHVPLCDVLSRTVHLLLG